MEGRSLLRVILSALIGLGVVVLLIILIIKLATGGGKAPAQVDVGKYADTASSVTLLVDAAPTQIDQDHKQVRITVSQTQNQIEIMQGYQGHVSDTRTYSNNSVAYGYFLQALKLQNFASGNTNKDAADFRGACPSGDRYVFTFNDGNKDVFKYWSSSCKGGTYKGNLANTLQLLRLQIPQSDFDDLTSSVVLGF